MVLVGEVLVSGLLLLTKMTGCLANLVWIRLGQCNVHQRDSFYEDRIGAVVEVDSPEGESYFLSLPDCTSLWLYWFHFIQSKQKTVTRDKKETELRARGRHDPCVVPRAVPMVEAMVALVLADALLQHYAQCQLLPQDPVLQGNELPQETTLQPTLKEQASMYSEHWTVPVHCICKITNRSTITPRDW